MVTSSSYDKIAAGNDFDRYRENNRLEAKDARGGLPRSLWETYSAFANTGGGVILLGVEELSDHVLHVVGLRKPEKTLDDFWNTVNNPQKASVCLVSGEDVEIVQVDGKDIIAIDVPRADRRVKPVYITGTYRRSHGGDYRCTVDEIQIMQREAAPDSQDKRLLEHMSLEDLNPDTLKTYRNRYRQTHEKHVWADLGDSDFLCRIGAAGADEDGKLHPTGAGLLMFGQEWRIIEEFPHYFLDYRAQGDPTLRWEDRFTSQEGDWSGNVYDFYFRAYARLQQELKVPFKMEGIYRVEDTPAHEALREALANCLTNANYYERRGIVALRMPDRIELSNPGAFRVSIEGAIAGGLSDPRNETLMRMFAFVEIGERAGSGLPKIYFGWKETGLPEPIIKEEYGPDRTTLILPLIEESDGERATHEKRQKDKGKDRRKQAGRH
jgi:ATP-dependent DNA helicase RecG